MQRRTRVKKFIPNVFNKLTFILYLLFLKTHALHCHTKHDHSSDVLLQNDISNLGGQHVVQHGSDNSNAAKLVQLEDDDDSTEKSTSSSSTILTRSESGVNVTRTGGGRVVSFCPARSQCYKKVFRP
jgi:hypothetical protein